MAETEIDKNEFKMASAYFQATQVVINGMTSVNYYNVLKPVEVKNIEKSQSKFWLYSSFKLNKLNYFYASIKI